ncbi:MAG: hypothetical protein JW795_14435 [Chitinivibrionales bacterium]|nr:hypothetical protein [Chitinivibrionales bacterium]
MGKTHTETATGKLQGYYETEIKKETISKQQIPTDTRMISAMPRNGQTQAQLSYSIE